jgi:hypothetical protein
MTEEKKKPYFNIAMGYVGQLIMLIAGVRYFLISDDANGLYLIILGSGFIFSYFRAAESKWGLTRKEKNIINGSLIICLIIIAIVTYCFI